MENNVVVKALLRVHNLIDIILFSVNLPAGCRLSLVHYTPPMPIH